MIFGPSNHPPLIGSTRRNPWLLSPRMIGQVLGIVATEASAPDVEVPGIPVTSRTARRGPSAPGESRPRRPGPPHSSAWSRSVSVGRFRRPRSPRPRSTPSDPIPSRLLPGPKPPKPSESVRLGKLIRHNGQFPLRISDKAKDRGMHGFALEYGRMASGVFAGLGRSTLTPAEPFKSGGDGFLPRTLDASPWVGKGRAGPLTQRKGWGRSLALCCPAAITRASVGRFCRASAQTSRPGISAGHYYRALVAFTPESPVCS